ncbi:ABC transporter ATP-binding protein [Massilia sp. X63]|uniref:ABC transporter ATP-binding protein n=1 Tax=Massilia sp. X63 TaxID=3237285 RepID=UPI0034DD3510
MSMLSVQDLTITWGGVTAVKDLSFEVMPKEIFSIIGPNGAGKTTTLNMISRLYNPSAGYIRLDGEDITRRGAHEVAGMGMARTFQNIELFEHASVLDNLLMGRHAVTKGSLLGDMLFVPGAWRRERDNRRVAEEVIDFLEIERYRNSTVAGLPYGVRKQVELARALCMRPKLLLLDEPCSGLNPEERRDMTFWIQDLRNLLGMTVILIEHDMSVVAKVSDRVLALNYGEVMALGTPAEVQRNPQVIKAYLGDQA